MIFSAATLFLLSALKLGQVSTKKCGHGFSSSSRRATQTAACGSVMKHW